MSYEKLNQPGERAFIKPADLVEGSLRFEWHTNADKANASFDGANVHYRIFGKEPAKVYENARLGPPTARYPSGVGIYLLKR